MTRTLPNIIITGTPGTGKTTHCEDLVEKVPELKHLSVNQVVKDKGCHEGWDEDYQSWIVDEDKVCRFLVLLLLLFFSFFFFILVEGEGGSLLFQPSSPWINRWNGEFPFQI